MRIWCSANEAFERFERQMEWHREDIERARKQARAELRDRFAIAALTGLKANPDFDGTKHDYAKIAYEYADAMLKARGDD